MSQLTKYMQDFGQIYDLK